MQKGSSLIIHISPIVQQGLKSILLSRNIGIHGVMNTIPECQALTDFEDCLILIDAQFKDDLKKHLKVLKKNGNTIIGIGTTGNTKHLEYLFDDMLFIDDTIDTINRAINSYISQVSDAKTDNQLTDRETEVLTLVAQGLSNKQIADQLFLSIHTVIAHRKNITFKLGIKSIPGLTLYAVLNNMIDLG